MKRLLCLLAFAAAAWAQPQNVWTVTFADPTGLACSAGSAVLYGTTGGLFSCQSGVYASAGGGGGGTGTVTHTAGALTSAAIVIGNGAADVKVSGVSIDTSNNITGAASISTAGGSTAGTLWMTQGTANTPSANQVGFQAPTSVPASFLFTLPSAPAAGLLHATNATPSVVSVSAVVDADLSGAVGVAHGGTALTTLTAHALYAGNATTAPSAIGPDASTTKALFSAGASADPAFRAIAAADLPASLSSSTSVNGTTIPASSTLPVTIASGTVSLGTTTVNTGVCSSAIDGGTATGVLTTDVVIASANADPTGVTGYTPATTGTLYVWAYPTADHVNFKLCNNTATNITPGSAVTLNWKVIR